VPAAWQGQTPPTWRGTACRVGRISLRLLNALQPDTLAHFPALVLLPDREPSGPRPEHLLLGSEFLIHYGFHLRIDYPAIRYEDGLPDAQRRLDTSVACGCLEKD
jgi:hypothetical protein